MPPLCPGCDAGLEPLDAHPVGTIAASRYRCPACGTRWNRDDPGLLTEDD